MAKRYEPHVALVDLFVGQESGATICERLRELVPPPNVLMISGAGRISPTAARAAGAAGFISKDWPAADIAGAVRMVGLGMTVFKPHEAPAGPPLTDREREVLEAVASGATNREIAERLFLSPHTVKEHTSSLYRKLGARNRAEAVQKAQRIGLIADAPYVRHAQRPPAGGHRGRGHPPPRTRLTPRVGGLARCNSPKSRARSPGCWA